MALAARGTGGALVLHGELGLGKSALLEFAAGTATSHTILRCRGYAEESGLPLAALYDLVKPLHPEAALETSDRLALSLGLLDLLSKTARERPVLCLIDDAHLIEPSTLDILLFAVRRLAGTPVAALLTTGAELPLSGIPRLRLAPLDREECLQLAADLGVPEPDRPRLAAACEGNPQAMLDLAAAPAHPSPRAPGDAPVPGPAGGLRLTAGSVLGRAYLAQLDRLPTDTRWLLLLAAADEEMSPARLMQAAELSSTDIAALAPAEQCGLIRFSGEHVEFALGLLRPVVYESATLAQRQAAHLLLARACDPNRQRLQRAVHLAAAACGPDPSLADELENAASHGGYSRASAALERAAQLTSEPAGAANRLVSAARYAWLSGSAHRARSLLTSAGPVADPAVGSRSELLAGEIELRSGAAASTLDAMLSAADRLAPEDRRLAINALMNASEAVCFSGDTTRFADIARRAVVLRRAGDSPRIELALEYLAGFAATFEGHHIRAGKALRRVTELATRIDDAAAHTSASAASLLLADDHGAHRHASRAVEVARAAGEVAALPIAMEMLACAEYWMGRYDAAAATSWEGLAAAQTCGQDNYASDHLAMLAVLAAIRGDREDCLARTNQVSVAPGAGQINRPKALCRWALAVLDILAGRPGDAVTRLASIADMTTGSGQMVIQVMATPWLAEAAAKSGEYTAARAALFGFDMWALTTGDPVRGALSARSHALLAPRGSDEAEEHFRRALNLHLQGDSDFERARTELLFGQELRRCRRAREAREHLHRALEAFGQLALPVWMDRCRAELRAAGEPVETKPADPSENLTPQQLQIARLVADGATNREVAASLFLSPRTVDHHMRNIFTKLGIRSRIELTKVML